MLEPNDLEISQSINDPQTTNNEPQTTNNEPQTTIHDSRSTSLKPINQFESIIQNKPNFPDAQMNVNSVITGDYENKRLCRCVKTNPIKPNTNPIQSQNKANTNPILERPKMNVTSILTKDYENETAFALRRNKPNQSQSDTLLLCRALLHSTH